MTGSFRTGSDMASDISPENEQFIQHELALGLYPGRGELLDDAVSLLKRQRELQREIQAGIDSGPSIPASEVFARLEDKARQLAGGSP
jgi:hypothetical protein